VRKHRNIRTRIMFTLTGMTAAILLALGLTFNIFIQGYVHNRINRQLDSISKSSSQSRRGSDRGQRSKLPEGRRDRITGTTGNALVLKEDGTLISSFHGDSEETDALAEYFTSNGIDRDQKYGIITVDSENYAISVSDDPIQKDCYIISYVDVTSIYEYTTRINLVLLIIIIVDLLMSVILSRHFARSFAEPVQELSVFAGEIGRGELTPRKFNFRDTEFDALGNSMNRMVSELSKSKKKQEIFFQNVSHELRTPLTSIRGNAEGVIYGVIEPQHAAGIILSESDKLSDMVEDILFLSRMGKSVSNAEIEPLDLREILSLCVSEQRASSRTGEISFSFDFDESPALFAIREQDAQRLFGNLISNALRYAKSEIVLTCHRDDDGLFISVADDGSGISEENLPRIFERFYKGKDGEHGIGLAIAKSVVESYHGKITAHNDSGAVFEVRFSLN